MLNINLQFTLEDAVKMLLNLGLEVKLTDTVISFPAPHGDGDYDEIVKIWMVTNPHTGSVEQVTTFFIKYLQTKKAEVFLQPSKLEIFNLFDK